MTPTIRPATVLDHPVIWRMLAPVIQAGETYALPRDWSQEDALAYWFGKGHQVFIAQDSATNEIFGTYFIKPNALGGGDHVANCGYITAAKAQGRGIARTMCQHSLELAKQQGFLAMQYNFVIATNTRAIALWTGMGFESVGRLPKAYQHPSAGMVDALVMYKTL